MAIPKAVQRFTCLGRTRNCTHLNTLTMRDKVHLLEALGNEAAFRANRQRSKDTSALVIRLSFPISLTFPLPRNLNL